MNYRIAWQRGTYPIVPSTLVLPNKEEADTAIACLNGAYGEHGNLKHFAYPTEDAATHLTFNAFLENPS